MRKVRQKEFFAFASVVAVVASTLVGANVVSADSVWVQSYQRASQTTTCDRPPESLTEWRASWANPYDPISGPTWHPSWELWANNGTGGWVCTRSITWARTPVVPTSTSTSTSTTPTDVAGVSGNTTVALTWVAPTHTGGDVIIGYRVQVSTTFVGGYADAAGCATASSSTALSCTATGLTNGTAYFFKVAAITSSGTGTYSAPSASVTPAVPCADGGTCAVGNIGPGGGLVFLISGGINYEMAPKTWNGGSEDPTDKWCNVTSPVTGAVSVAVGAGASNTAAMDAACTSGAGQAASDLVLGGKTDWFLPSKNELFEMYSYSLVMPASVAATYAFVDTTYWSSTQNDTNNGSAQCARFDLLTHPDCLSTISICFSDNRATACSYSLRQWRSQDRQVGKCHLIHSCRGSTRLDISIVICTQTSVSSPTISAVVN